MLIKVAEQVDEPAESAEALAFTLYSFTHLPRMIATVLLLDELVVDVRVDLRGADVRVAEQFLQNPQVHSCFQTVRGKAVAECVRRNLLAQVHRVLLHDFPCPHAAHRFPVRIENDSVACGVRERAAFLNPDAQVFFRLAAQRNEALLVPFAYGREPFVVEVDLRKLDPERF